jgi:succinyl-CoA synthetase alpha subunit
VSILLEKDARVLIVGIAGRFGRRAVTDLGHAGTDVVAGVAYSRSPAQRGHDIPVFSSVQEARESTGANAAIVFVPAVTGFDAVIETMEAGLELVVYPAEGLPVGDAIELRACARSNGVRLIGPNTPGIISPGKAKLGFMPTECYTRGPVGIISRSGSFSYETAAHLTGIGLGQSTAVGIGGDPIKGLSAGEALGMFHEDPETTAIAYLGEIGGGEEYCVAEYAARGDAKPVVAMMVGRTAPPGKQMGHAAALIGSARDGWQAKAEAMTAARVMVARTIAELGHLALQAVSGSPATGKPNEGVPT